MWQDATRRIDSYNAFFPHRRGCIPSFLVDVVADHKRKYIKSTHSLFEKATITILGINIFTIRNVCSYNYGLYNEGCRFNKHH